jgi:hypothetical protein
LRIISRRFSKLLRSTQRVLRSIHPMGGVSQHKPAAESGAEKLALGMQLLGRDNADSHTPSTAMFDGDEKELQP